MDASVIVTWTITACVRTASSFPEALYMQAIDAEPAALSIDHCVELDWEMTLVSRAGEMLYGKRGTICTPRMLLRFSVGESRSLDLGSWSRSSTDVRAWRMRAYGYQGSHCDEA